MLNEATNLKPFFPFFGEVSGGASLIVRARGDEGVAGDIGVLLLAEDDNDRDESEAGDSGSKLSQERRALTLRIVSPESMAGALGISNFVTLKAPCSSGASS